MRKFLVLFFATWVMSSQSHALAESGKVKVWHVVHDSWDVGKLSILAGDAGVRIDIPKFGLCVVASPPLWKAFILNVDDRLFSPTSAQKLRREGIVPEMGDLSPDRPEYDDPALWKNVRTDSVMISGIKTIRRSSDADVKFTDWSATTDRVKKFIHINGVEYYSAADCKIPIQSLTLIQSLYKVPAQGGIPLQYVYKLDRNQRAVPFHVLVYKQERVDGSLFKMPSNYNVVKRPGDIVGQKRMKGFEDWASDIGLGESLGKTKMSRKHAHQ